MGSYITVLLCQVLALYNFGPHSLLNYSLKGRLIGDKFCSDVSS